MDIWLIDHPAHMHRPSTFSPCAGCSHAFLMDNVVFYILVVLCSPLFPLLCLLCAQRLCTSFDSQFRYLEQSVSYSSHDEVECDC